MLNKKLMSLVLAGAMVASLAVPAFAATSDDGGSTDNRTTNVTATYQDVSIAVWVPTTATVYVNPYALPVEIGKDADDNAIKAENQQIVTKPLVIKNQSEVALDINVSYTSAVKGNFTFATAAIDDTNTKNAGFVYLDVQQATSLTGADADVTDAAIATAWKDVTWDEYSSTAKNEVLLKATTTAVSQTGVGTLAKPTLDDAGAFSEYAAGSIAFVGITGSCVTSPKTAWTTKDGFTVKLAFTFTPNTSDASEEVEADA
jgi:hypothetical protein